MRDQPNTINLVTTERERTRRGETGEEHDRTSFRATSKPQEKIALDPVQKSVESRVQDSEIMCGDHLDVAGTSLKTSGAAKAKAAVPPGATAAVLSNRSSTTGETRHRRRNLRLVMSFLSR